MSCYLYILECADGKFYAGSARGNLEHRVHQHNHSHYNGWTAKRLPVKLVYAQEFSDIKDAISAERQIKGWRREKKIALINSNYESLPALAQSYQKDRRIHPESVEE